MIRRFEGQPRGNLDSKYILKRIAEYAESMKAIGQIQPAIVKKLAEDSYELIAGELRFLAAKKAGIPFLEAILDTEERSFQQQYEIAAIENLCRTPHTPLEKMKIAIRFRDVRPPRTNKEIANRVGWGVNKVANYLKLERLAPEVLKRLEPDAPKGERLTVIQAVRIAKYPREYHVEAAQSVAANRLPSPHVDEAVEGMMMKNAGGRVIRIRKAKSEYRKFEVFLFRARRDSGVFAGKSSDYFSQMFLKLPPRERLKAMSDLKKIAANAEALRSTLAGLFGKGDCDV